MNFLTIASFKSAIIFITNLMAERIPETRNSGTYPNSNEKLGLKASRAMLLGTRFSTNSYALNLSI